MKILLQVILKMSNLNQFLLLANNFQKKVQLVVMINLENQSINQSFTSSVDSAYLIIGINVANEIKNEYNVAHIRNK